MTRKAREYLDAIERPLQYVYSGDDRRLSTVKNLSSHIMAVSKRALASALQASETHLFRSLQELFSGFEELESPEKKRRIQQALVLLTPGRSTSSALAFRPEEHMPHTEARLKEAKKTLDKNVQYVKGVGPAIAAKFGKVGVDNVGDLLTFFPNRYEDRRFIRKIRELREDSKSTVIGTVEFSGVAFYRGLRKRVFEAVIEDGSGKLKLKWFHFAAASMSDRLKRGQKVIVCGKPKAYRKQMEMHHPDFEVYSGEIDSVSFGRIVPVYREIGGLYQKTLRKILHHAVSTYSRERSCALPIETCQKHDLLPPWRAIRELHLPEKEPFEGHRSKSEESLSFEELFFYSLSLALRKQQIKKKDGIAFSKESPRYDRMVKALPFELTRAQKTVLRALRNDMALDKAMNRLLQGDVGSGKTIVAFLAALIAVDHGYQAVFMAPTEILAEQHQKNLQQWAKQVDVQVRSLHGRQPEGERRKILSALASGKIDILVGTHAILEGDVEFKSLGVVIVDEQHRFGVRQRATIRSKAQEPDVLVMSATPIPRTLALTLYGDLDVSILDELPAGRKPITTRIFADRDRAHVFQKVKEEVGKGRQAFIVYPLVDVSDRIELKDATTMAEHLQKDVFPNLRVGLVHGQLPGAEKEEWMSRFSKGEIDVLVSTTIIEVGIDIPNATVMVIEHPERFGLSQLHQLRGRIGRGEEDSYCFLIRPPKISQLALKRLRSFASIHDGFLLAEEDLRMRGPGDFFGVAQSGFPAFAVAVFPRDLDLLELARQETFSLLQRDPELKHTGHQHLRWWIDQHWSERLQLVRVG